MGNDTAYFYEPTAFNPTVFTSAYVGAATAAAATVTYTGSQYVLGTANYAFTFTNGANVIASSDVSDYFMV